MSIERAPKTRGRIRRGGFQPRAVVAIAAAWMLMWDQLSWGNLANGILVGLLVTILFPMPTVVYEGRPRPGWIIYTAARFMWDLVKASLQVTWLAIKPGTVHPGSIIEVHLKTNSNLYLTLVAIMSTLVPGSAVVEARRRAGVIYLHELMVHDREQAEHARTEVLELERRIVKSLGSAREIALVDANRGRESDGPRAAARTGAKEGTS